MEDTNRMLENERQNSGDEFQNICYGPERKKLWDLMEKPNRSNGWILLSLPTPKDVKKFMSYKLSLKIYNLQTVTNKVAKTSRSKPRAGS